MTKNVVIPKIKGSNCSSFNNGLHMQFHRSQYDLVKGADTHKLNISDEVLNSWKESIDMEMKISKHARESVHTAVMKQRDKERSRILVHIFGVVRTQRISPVANKREAANRLYVIFKPYFGTQTEAMEVKSGRIYGLIKATTEYAADVKALELNSILNELTAVNEAYEKLRVERRSDKVAEKLPKTILVRKDSDQLFYGICRHIEAAYVYAENEDKPIVVKLVEEINNTSADFKVSHKLSLSHKADKDFKGEEAI